MIQVALKVSLLCVLDIIVIYLKLFIYLFTFIYIQAKRLIIITIICYHVLFKNANFDGINIMDTHQLCPKTLVQKNIFLKSKKGVNQLRRYIAPQI